MVVFCLPANSFAFFLQVSYLFLIFAAVTVISIYQLSKTNVVMRKSILNLLGSMVLAIPMMFSSCGNGDNALEEIINGNTTVSGLADAVKDGAEVTLDLALLLGEECPVKVYFKKEGNSFTFLKKIKVDNTDYDWSEEPDLTAYEERVMPAHDAGFLPMVFEFLVDGTIEFTHDTATNQLKFLLKVESGGAATRTSTAPTVIPLLAVNFDVNKNTFSQFSYPYLGSVYFKGISVDGVDKSSQIKSSYDKKASVYAGTTPTLFLYIFYNEGETWTNLSKRYYEEGGCYLLKTAEEISAVGDGINKSDLFMTMGFGCAAFLYKEAEPSTYVSGSHKAGYKANGSTVNEDGYMFTDLMMPLG